MAMLNLFQICSHYKFREYLEILEKGQSINLTSIDLTTIRQHIPRFYNQDKD